MRFVRGIIGGIVGGVLGAVAWIALEHFMADQFPTEWSVVLVGILAGLGVRCAANADRASFCRGTVAIVVTLLCILGARISYAQYMTTRDVAKAALPVTNLNVGKDNTGQPGASDEGDDTVPADSLEQSPAKVIQPPATTGKPARLKFAFNPRDMLWFGLSGFIAYLLGKSARQKPSIEEGSAGSDRPSTDTASGEA